MNANELRLRNKIQDNNGFVFDVVSNKGDNIGTTDYVVYQKENVLTLEVL